MEVTLRPLQPISNKLVITGKVPCSTPRESFSQLDAPRLDSFMSDHPDQAYYFEIEGDSMTGAEIYSGDVVTVDPALLARDGEIVLARVDRVKYTIKRLMGRYLVSDDERVPIVVVADSEIQIMGVVTSVVHRFRRKG